MLKSAGVCLALPWLESRAVGAEEEVPRRMVMISNNLGVLPKPFFPKEAGFDYSFSPYLEPLRGRLADQL